MDRWEVLIESLFEDWDREINDQGTLSGIQEKVADAKAEAGSDYYMGDDDMGAIDPDQNNMTPAFDGDLAGRAAVWTGFPIAQVLYLLAGTGERSVDLLVGRPAMAVRTHVTVQIWHAGPSVQSPRECPSSLPPASGA
jgi:hypothetical protein